MKTVVTYPHGYAVTVDDETPSMRGLNADTTYQRLVAAAAVVEKKYASDFAAELEKTKSAKATKA